MRDKKRMSLIQDWWSFKCDLKCAKIPAEATKASVPENGEKNYYLIAKDEEPIKFFVNHKCLKHEAVFKPDCCKNQILN
jgi:hypothetical protein